MSDDSDEDVLLGLNSSRRKSKNRIMSSESSSCSSNNSSPILRTTKKRIYRRVVSDDSDSDSDSLNRFSRKRKKTALITSDSEDDSDSSDDSIIVRKSKKIANIIESDDDANWETDESDLEDPKKDLSDCDSSGQPSDECPICLLPIRKQELGVPESCDHSFCLACILEWSKNVNTCPIDRKEYSCLCVKKKIGGETVRKVPIEKPVPPDEPQLEPICCEICGSGDREDRLLLCDGCDLGFHLECLTPPLEEVPMGSWYCNVCGPQHSFERELSYLMPNEDILRILRVNVGPRRSDTRLIPRTSQTERVISRILNNRSAASSTDQPSSSSRTTTAGRRKRRKRATKRKYRMVYEYDEKTDTITSKKKLVKGRRRGRARRRVARQPKTAKKRLAQQLGICSTSSQQGQSIPDVRASTGSNCERLNVQRHQAGIPTLHLFGQRDEIEYFSEVEEDIGGSDYLVRRRANHSDVAAFRRAARRKGAFLPQAVAAPTTSSAVDLLGSILNSQSNFFSKNAKFSVDTTGKFKVESKPDLKNAEHLTRKTPYGGNNRNNERRTNQPYQNAPYQGSSYYPYDSYGPSSTSENYRSYPQNSQGGDQDMPQDYTQSTLSSYDRDLDSENSQKNEQGEDSDIDIYSDIEESVSTSKIEEDNSERPLNLCPVVAPPAVPSNNSDLETNDSENEMVIDTEKVATPTQDEEEEIKEETAVTSSEDSKTKPPPSPEAPVGLHSTSEPVQSFIEDEEDEDGCPNFNIYSTESINLAKNTDITLNSDQNNQVVSSTPLPEPPKPPPGLIDGDFGPDDVYDPGESFYDPEAAYNSEKEEEPEHPDVYDPEQVYDTPEDTSEPPKAPEEEKETPEEVEEKPEKIEKEEQPQEEEEKPPRSPTTEVSFKNPNALYSDSEDEEVVKITRNSFIVGDISTMTEDVSEEERSYTPCLDEKASENKRMEDLGTEMISDDEKNDFDESHEHKTASEGDALEINAKESEIDMIRPEDYEEGEIVDKNKAKQQEKEQNETETPKPEAVEPEKAKTKEKKEDKQNKESKEKEKQESFKKLSKSNKERNYRDKERSRSRGKEDKREDKSKNKEKRKRKEIERYDVRALIAEKPRRLKDKFGRDIRKSSSRSRSRSYTPKNSPEKRPSPKRRLSSESRERRRKKRRSSEAKSESRERRRSLSRSRRRRSRSRSKKKKSKDRSKRRKRERSTSRTYTPTRKRRKEWEEGRYSRERAYSAEARWTPSLSRSPEVDQRGVSPSWTPPRRMESAAVDPRGLTVILQNDQNKKKKEKRKKNVKKGKEVEKRNKRRRKDQTPPPSKEVFASGDNILVSVSFNKENERRERDVYTKKKKEVEDKEKKKRSMRRKKKNQELSTIKPVAIIDLERSPFRELTPSPKDVIVLSDEDHVENNAADAQDVCDSSQQVASPENVQVYMTGPKTPPEPQVKFSLPSKQPVLRPLSINPLHDPEDEIENEGEVEEEAREMSDVHIGPNTPPEPPNSPPSSPDAYDPFEPTKSRSPSPDQAAVAPSEDGDKIGDVSVEKNTVLPASTPPTADIQPADSQSSLLISRDSSKSPEQVNRSSQALNKTVPPQTFTPASNTLTSTPLPPSANRINILSSTILGNVSSTIPQRVVLSPIKVSPVKAVPKTTTVAKAATVVKATPVKATPSKAKAGKSAQQNGNDSTEVISLDFDSPYSPGSSDYEDLFEPPPEVVTKKSLNKTAPAAMQKDQSISSSNKTKNSFDSLFDMPVNKLKKVHVGFDKGKAKKSKGTKIVGVKLDEDHLKILDELPNSAVEMQVKDKFLKKLNRQERVVEEVKLVLKPYYNKKKIDKEEYKDIMRRAVPKICHNKSGEINPTRIKNLVEAYVKKIRHSKPKVTSSSSYNPLKG